MTSQTAIHQRNLESSILFMQQEHANTLKALHEEIHNLQKKCSDLTFQLTMQGYASNETGDSEDRVKELESNLTTKQKQVENLQEEMEVRDKKIKVLDHEVRLQKRKHLDELRSQTQTINNLKAELEAKSNNVAYLTTELHRIKIKQKMDVDAAVESSIRRTQHVHLPTPPKELLQSKMRRTHVRRGVAVNSSLEDVHGHSLRVNSGKSSGSSHSESPDLTPFIVREESNPKVEMKQQAVLPPIPVATTHDGKSVLVHKVVPSQHRLSRRKAGSSSPEIATLAVDRVSHTDPTWVHARESQSSEYN